MNRTFRQVGFIVLLTVLLVILNGCHTYGSIDISDNRDVFVMDDGKLSNGTLTYTLLPDKWSYEGEYPYRFGKTQEGKTLYAADSNGTIVKEEKPFYADMDYRPWIREDAELPDLYGEDYDVKVYVFKKDRSITLEGPARDEIVNWYHALLNGSNPVSSEEIDAEVFGNMHAMLNGGYVNTGSLNEDLFGTLYFESTKIKGLEYYNGYELRKISNRFVIVDDYDIVYATFGEDSALYQALIDE